MKDQAMVWVEAACRGDEDAATRLVTEYQARLYGFLRRLTGSDTDAAELTQRTYCRAWSTLSSFEGRSSVSSWLHGIAYRTYVDWLRVGRRFESRADAWWRRLPDGSRLPDQQTAASDTSAAVYAAVDQLEPGLRETIHLHYYQGLSIQETADTLGIATSTVKYRVREALTQLQRRLADEPSPAVVAPRRSEF
jgi:RNA polymerase sigma-70 factor (ECF subfamily)